MTEIFFAIPGEPVSQQRPRFARIGAGVRTYDPAPCKDYKDYVRILAQSHRPGEPISGPVALQLTFYFTSPKGKRPRYHTKKPDVDNLAKCVMDALNGIIWRDDAQVDTLTVRKLYAQDEPQVEVLITGRE